MSLVRFVPGCFVLFDAFVDGIVLLIFLSGASWLVYRNSTDFYVWLLNYSTLLNSFIITGLFFFFFGDLMCKIGTQKSPCFYHNPGHMQHPRQSGFSYDLPTVPLNNMSLLPNCSFGNVLFVA